jgi:hypothetical protein
MWFLLLFIILFFSLFSIWKNAGAKKLFNIPWYYRVVSLDMGGNKAKNIFFNGVYGKPDAIFKHILLPKYIVGELKGRLFKADLRGYEYAQIMLYIGIMKKTRFGFIKGKIAYKNKVIDIDFDKRIFREIMHCKPKAIQCINKH